jgi:hypothetical protein
MYAKFVMKTIKHVDMERVAGMVAMAVMRQQRAGSAHVNVPEIGGLEQAIQPEFARRPATSCPTVCREDRTRPVVRATEARDLPGLMEKSAIQVTIRMRNCPDSLGTASD